MALEAQRSSISDNASERSTSGDLAGVRSGDAGPGHYDTDLSPDDVFRFWDYQTTDWSSGRRVWISSPELRASHEAALSLLAPRPGDRVLDLGCGNGVALAALARAGADVVGLDYSPGVVRSLSRAIALSDFPGRAHVLQGDAELTCFPSASFDKVISCDLFEHLSAESKARAAAEACRVLRPGGRLVLHTPNLTYLQAKTLLRGANPFDLRRVYPSDPGLAEAHFGLTRIGAALRLLRAEGFLCVRQHYVLMPRACELFRHRAAAGLFTVRLPVFRRLLNAHILISADKPPEG